MKGKIKIEEELCKQCGLCINWCSKKIIATSKKLNLKGYFPAVLKAKDKCTGCALCAIICPEVAIEVYRE
ncbi:MAG: 4Fe-4S dicluster domain-containing protein [Deltaproteobacteria bacterium]|nr:MAG: 4Fe-4S dicluster domain-containing protein [Deltaproteobacteria bacterium]